METKQAIRTLRLLLGAAAAEKVKTEIAPEYIPQIARARVGRAGAMRQR